jgi:hypothetical protein
MLRAGAALAAAAALIAASSASARTYVRTWKVQASPISVKVEFFGDQAAGCVDHGTCETYGTATYVAPESFGVLTGRSQSRRGIGLRAYGLAVNLDDPARLAVSATTRGAASPCTDEATGLLSLFGINRRRDFVFGSIPPGAFPGLGPHAPFADFLASRCPGPTGADVRSGLAVQRLPENFVNLRKITIDLGRSAEFSGGGFSGTVTTTGRLTLRK